MNWKSQSSRSLRQTCWRLSPTKCVLSLESSSSGSEVDSTPYNGDETPTSLDQNQSSPGTQQSMCTDAEGDQSVQAQPAISLQGEQIMGSEIQSHRSPPAQLYSVKKWKVRVVWSFGQTIAEEVLYYTDHLRLMFSTCATTQSTGFVCKALVVRWWFRIRRRRCRGVL